MKEAFLKSLPRKTIVTFRYSNFDGSDAYGDAQVTQVAEGFYLSGKLGCGKTRANVRDALLAYLGGRELISHQHHN